MHHSPAIVERFLIFLGLLTLLFSAVGEDQGAIGARWNAAVAQAFGTGKVLVSSYGAIVERSVLTGEKYIVDTSHLVAFDANMAVAPKTVGGFKSTLFSGEGLVVELTGPGMVYMQTRSPRALINWIIPQLPKPEIKSS